ncbi:uncharacterized protein LOC124261281 [Haliotis rubra]|uniref:uncharacterized protein LOC124261281 n=1 Tax=Haliotis rubra TaxID=36100 RepID=UPI001EE60ECE|nr:uncharacterized protein LOC124261281 [Haliotis rubra]
MKMGVLVLCIGLLAGTGIVSADHLTIVRAAMTFDDAENRCKTLGGHLASIHSDVENDLAHRLCDMTHGDCWLGYRRLDASSNVFAWTDGSKQPYTNFHSGEPDNWNHVEGCVQLLLKFGLGKWSDQDCNANYDHAYPICRVKDSSATLTAPDLTTPSTGSTNPGGFNIQLVNVKMTFKQAEDVCVGYGGHLVSIHSKTENDQVNQLCRKAGGSCWIGLSLDNSWSWTDGSVVKYWYFHTGEPDNWNGVEKCAQMMAKFSQGVWSDQDCDAAYDNAFPVCKFPVGSHPVITTPTPTTAAPNNNNNGGHPSQAPQSSQKCPDGVNDPIDYGDLSKPGSGRKLQIKGKHFYINDQKVFLSGANQAWVAYGYDFGNNQYEYRKTQFECFLRKVQQAGGNSMRTWIHVTGQTTPEFDSSGHVVSLDKEGTFISDIKKYLRTAAKYNIVIFLTLWNGALHGSKMDGLVKDESILQSYIDNGLIPLAKAIKDEPGLGGYDIINEIEGLLIPGETNSEPCFDTNSLQGSGADWAGKVFSMQDFLRFISRQADAIRNVDPSTPITAGSWNVRSNTDQFTFFNYYKDECMKKAGGKPQGHLTFYSTHTYDGEKTQIFDSWAPFLHNASEYKLDKPLVIAEFNQVRGAGMTSQDQFKWSYFHGYDGAWSWYAMAQSAPTDTLATQMLGMESIKSETDDNAGGIGRLHVNLT